MMASLATEHETSERQDNKVTSDKKVCIEALLACDWNNMKVIRDSGASTHRL